jgi:hypothetical protein
MRLMRLMLALVFLVLRMLLMVVLALVLLRIPLVVVVLLRERADEQDWQAQKCWVFAVCFLLLSPEEPFREDTELYQIHPSTVSTPFEHHSQRRLRQVYL